MDLTAGELSGFCEHGNELLPS